MSQPARDSSGRAEESGPPDAESRGASDDSRGNGAHPPAHAQNGGLDAEHLTAVRETLRQKRSELLEQQATQLSALHAPDKHHLADLEEMASDSMDTDSLCTLVDIGASTLAEIDTALLKIEEGTYGICELCEQPIHPDRLEVLPFASLCVKCQAMKEASRDGMA